MPEHPNSFDARDTLKVGDREHTIFRLDALQSKYDVARLPFSLKVLLENLLRTEGNGSVTADDVEKLARWDAKAEPAERDRLHARARDPAGLHRRAGGRRPRGDARRDEPTSAATRRRSTRSCPSSWSSTTRSRSTTSAPHDAFRFNAENEFERNHERYEFLRWGQNAFDDFSVVPPDTGIVHQVNLEYLARVVFVDDDGNAYPDTLVGTDSHTTMINGLGVLGWGVGGIEAEAAMLGQPISMLIPQVVGFKLHGELPEGATATDLVLTVTEMLRKKGVVGKFVEFYGAGVGRLPLADRATIANMAPSTARRAAIFPIDDETLRYMRLHRAPEGAHRPRRGLLPRSRASGTTRTPRSRRSPTPSSSTSATSCPRWPVPSARRIAWRCTASRSPSARRWSTSSAATPRRRWPTPTTRRWPRPSRPPTRPPTTRRATIRRPPRPRRPPWQPGR